MKPMSRFLKQAVAVCAVLAFSLGFSACGGGEEDPAPASGQLPTATTADGRPSASPVVTAAFPVTIRHEGRSVTIPAEPRRIVALSNDVADIVLRLAGPERVVAVPASNATPSLAASAPLVGSVPTKLPPGTNPEPEQIVALRPDLVLITTRHGGEQDAAKLLEQVGVPMLVFAHWGSPQEVAENVRVLGEALGVREKAEQLLNEMTEGMARVEKALAKASGRPRVLAMSDQAQRPFIIGKSGGGITGSLIEMAGGQLVADQGGPAQAERIVAMNPDFIVIIDVWGKGLENYRTLLDSPAIQSLPAVKENRVVVIPAWQAFLPTDRVFVGLEAIAKALHPEAF